MAKILLVDDDRRTLSEVTEILQVAGHQVLGTDRPDDAVSLARVAKPALVLLEVSMGEDTSLQVLRTLRSDGDSQRVPVLYLGTADRQSDRIRRLVAGADDFLTKPFETEELLGRVTRLLGRFRGSETGNLSMADLEEALAAGEFRSGSRLGRYELQELLGQGGMGVVFLAWDTKLKRSVALKTIRLQGIPQDQRNNLARELAAEAIKSAQLAHPNVVAVYDASDNPEQAYIVMEYVEGTNLEQYVWQHGPLPEDQAIAVTEAIALALEASHSRDLLHHDVKPSNVLLGRNRSIKVVDFGIATFVSSLEETQTINGTLGYLPPEALLGKGYTIRGDMYGLGSVLLYALTGQHPFATADRDEQIRRTIAGSILKETAMVPLSVETRQLLNGLHASDPDDRIGTAREVLDLIESHPMGHTRWRPATI